MVFRAYRHGVSGLEVPPFHAGLEGRIWLIEFMTLIIIDALGPVCLALFASVAVEIWMKRAVTDTTDFADGSLKLWRRAHLCSLLMNAAMLALARKAKQGTLAPPLRYP